MDIINGCPLTRLAKEISAVCGVSLEGRRRRHIVRLGTWESGADIYDLIATDDAFDGR